MEREINISLKTKYSTYGKFSDRTEKIWFVCHGYGQLAEYFIKNFEVLDAETNYVIAPQGLSKFYLKGFTGRVGASWMTKEDRLTDIENQWTLLDTIFEKEFAEIDLTQKKVNVLGFSQGAATICRWLTFTKNKIDKLIIWAGDIPSEFYQNDRCKILPLSFVYGKQDPFVPFIKVEKQKESLKQYNIAFEILTFEGKHELNKDILLAL
jgi:predicted esterase